MKEVTYDMVYIAGEGRVAQDALKQRVKPASSVYPTQFV